MKQVAWEDPKAFWRLLMRDVPPEIMPKHQRKMQYFGYEDHELAQGIARSSSRLVTTDTMIGIVQKITGGAGTPLHLHATLDGFWMVLKGRASFAGDDGIEHELGPLEGVSVPRGTAYAFKQVGDEPLHLLQVEAIYPAKKHTTKTLAQNQPQGQITNGQATMIPDWALYDARKEEA